MLFNFHDVGKFHQKFGLPNSTYDQPGPREVDKKLMDFRIKFMYEELEEFVLGANEQDHEKMFDSLIDLVYVAMGTAHLLGYPWDEGWDEVQRANMTKERCELDHVFVHNDTNTCVECGQPRQKHSLRGSVNDVIKPEGWLPPNVKGVLRRWGFRV